jgi:hypothetical protein
MLATFPREQGMPDDIETVAPEHIRAFLASQRERANSAPIGVTAALLMSILDER